MKLYKVVWEVNLPSNRGGSHSDYATYDTLEKALNRVAVECEYNENYMHTICIHFIENKTGTE